MEEYFKNKKGFLWLFIWEMLCMFSNKPSFFASKRWERFAAYSICMWMVVGYVSRKWSELTATEVVSIGIFLLTYSAWNAVQLRKDQNQNLSNSANTTTPQ